MLFLGAGASTVVGIGDIEDFTREIINRTEGNLRDNINIIQRILSRSQEHINFRFNLEVLYSILNGIANRWRLLNELGPFPILMHNFLNENEEFNSLQITQQEFSNFEGIVENVIVNTINAYNFDSGRRQRAKQFYDELFRIPIRNSNHFLNAASNNTPAVFNTVSLIQLQP